MIGHHAPAAANPAENQALAALLARLLTSADAALDRDREAARSYIAEAAALLAAGREEVPASGARVLAPWQIRKVMAHVDAHLGDTIPVGCLAGLTRLSTSHFSRAFKGSFGTSPHRYVMDRRIQTAQKMMLESQETLAQIALACGLSDQAHFSRAFQRVVGASPHAWRRHNRADPDGAGQSNQSTT